ncbi:hypothetical protein [Sicyoidochytrium minutum DNA virus]|nr:hypothetical protein [Sicyoidochytrium minutum DNA virus]
MDLVFQWKCSLLSVLPNTGQNALLTKVSF